MQARGTDLGSTVRTSRVAALAFGLTILIVAASHAGPSDHCAIEKRCSVGGSEPTETCVAEPGEEVTYTYEFSGGTALVFDDKLGLIGEWSGQTLTRTTALTQTTTNTAYFEPLEAICITCDCTSTVTVFVGSPTPTATPTASPTATPTATPTAPPTPPPLPERCTPDWPVIKVVTTAKGQSPTNNAKVTHVITANIIDSGSLGDTAHRIKVCAGTLVTSVVTDTTGTPVNTAGGSLTCNATGCSGVVNVTEKYRSISADGRDRDSITFLPQ